MGRIFPFWGSRGAGVDTRVVSRVEISLLVAEVTRGWRLSAVEVGSVSWGDYDTLPRLRDVLRHPAIFGPIGTA